MLRRGLKSPERDEIERRAEYFELEQRRRNKIVGTIAVAILLAASWLVGSLLGALL